jgi:hypothetical protein
MEKTGELMEIAKHVLDKKDYDKVNSIKDKNEKTEALKYSIILSLENKYHDLHQKIQEHRKKGKNVFFPETKSQLIPLKIKMLGATFNKQDLIRVMKLFDSVEAEIRCLGS